MNWPALILPFVFSCAAFAFTAGGFWKRLSNAALAWFFAIAVIAVVACLS